MAVIALLVLTAAQAGAPELEARLRQAGIPASEVVVAFAPSSEIEALARELARGSTEPIAIADFLYDGLVELKRRGTIQGDRDNSPKQRAPKTAVGLLAAARTPGADTKAGCYELTALFVAAARSVGVAALGVEREEPWGTGQIGHVMAAVRDVGGALRIYDLQNETQPPAHGVRELSDLELAAHHYNHLSVAAYLGGDLRRALRAIDWALSLASSAPSFVNNRATVLAALGEREQAVAEATHAVHLAPRVPLYRYQLGRLLLAGGELEAAATAMQQALALRPSYHLARRDLAWAYLLSGRDAAGQEELDRVLRADPSTPDVHLYLGLLHIALGRKELALEVAREGLSRAGVSASLTALAALAGGAGVAPPAEVARLREVLAAAARARASRGLPAVVLP